MKPIVVTSGVDSEYVLSDLAEYLRDRDFQLHELDFGVTQGDVRPLLERLRGERVAYVTSAHTNLTSRMAKTHTPGLLKKYPNYLAPLEILAHLNPLKSFFIPHDLLSPFGESNLDEYRFLDLFDHVMSPIADSDLLNRIGKHTQIHHAGWMKFQDTDESQALIPQPKLPDTPRITFFISFVEHFQAKHGALGIAEYFKEILVAGVRVKLPVWQGVEEIEQAIREHTDATVVSARCQSTSLIAQSDVVICNGASSVAAESILRGVPVICLVDDEAELAHEKRQKLETLPQVVFHDFHARARISDDVWAAALSQQLTSQLKPFDFELMHQLLSQV